jgi:hypothetical protein
VVGAVTDAIDTAHTVVGALGERFTYYRLPPNDGADIRKDLAERALSNGNMLTQMRRELAEAVAGLFGSVEIPARPPIPEGADRERLIALASLVARCRSAVERDYKTREIELVYSPESPARIAQALARLSAGLRVIGADDGRRWEVIRHVGLSSMPKTRRAVLDHLAASTERLTTATIAARVRLPTQTTRRCLEDLTAHNVANRYPGGKGKHDHWSLTDDARAEYELAVTVPGMSEGVYSEDSPKNHTDIPSDDIPGTVELPSEDDGPRHCWSCGAELLEELDDQCEHCAWLRCHCGACGCTEVTV